MVEEAWYRDRPLLSAISEFTTKVKKWNHEVFGNLTTWKRRVLARLGGVQKALSCNPSESLI